MAAFDAHHTPGCSRAAWLRALRDKDFFATTRPGSAPLHRVLVNVGANKGYGVANALGLWAPATLASPADLFAFLTSPTGGKLHPVVACGPCGSCKDTLIPAPAALTAGVSARVSLEAHAVEPLPSNAALLAGYAAELRGRGAAAPTAELTVHAIGIAEADGIGSFEERGAGDEGSSLGNVNREGGRLVDVPVMSLDSFAASRLNQSSGRIIDLLLVDLEGYEPDVIRGGRNALRSTRIVVFEYSNLGSWASATLEVGVQVLNDLGFDCYFELDERLTRLNRGCWHSRFEHRRWSNVLCANRRDSAWAAVVEGFADDIS